MVHKIVIIGAAGRMGKALIRCLVDRVVPGVQLAGAVDLAACPEQGQDAGLAAGGPSAGLPITADLDRAAAGCDAAIDFSFHQSAAAHAEQFAKWGKPLVIGTTGLTPAEQQAVTQAARMVPIVLAPNMSLGVNLLLTLVRQTAAALRGRGFDVEIIERHHRRKQDAPSGTALGLGAAVAEGYGWDLAQTAVHGRAGLTGARPEQQIGFHAVRGGDWVGDHTVIFAAEGESLELSHRATSRATFALGALRAAAWVVGQPAGLYSMQDVLGLARR